MALYMLGAGKFNEEAFKVVDNLLALANRYGVRVMFDPHGGVRRLPQWHRHLRGLSRQEAR